MITLVRSQRFENERRKFVKNSPQRAENLIKSLQRFVGNPRYPSLHIEKLQGSKIWTIRIDLGNRIFFLWINQTTALLIDIGPHDKYRQF